MNISGKKKEEQIQELPKWIKEKNRKKSLMKLLTRQPRELTAVEQRVATFQILVYDLFGDILRGSKAYTND